MKKPKVEYVECDSCAHVFEVVQDEQGNVTVDDHDFSYMDEGGYLFRFNHTDSRGSECDSSIVIPRKGI